MKVMQTCGWCKEVVQHAVMSMEQASTGVFDSPECPRCGAGLLPFETPDKIARLRSEGAPEKKQGEPVWSAAKE